jgi:MFS family permease
MAIPLVPTLVMIIGTYLNAQVIFLLRDDEMFNIADDKIGIVSSSLIFYSLPGCVIATFFSGYLFDIFGRKITLFVSFLGASLLLAAVPWTSPNVYPWLLVIKIFIGILTSGTLSNPLIADYIHKTALGKAASLGALGFVSGEVLSMGVLFTLTKDMNPYWAFATAAGVSLVVTFMFLCIVKEPKLRNKNKQVFRMPTAESCAVPSSPAAFS